MTAATASILLRDRPWPGVRFAYAAMAAVFLLALVLQLLASPVTDVSWLLVVGERMLSGDRLYVDIWETNPPLAVFLYMPALLTERMLGIPAEVVVTLQVLAAAALSILVCTHILGRNSRGEVGCFVVALAVVLTLLPYGVFAQREHVAVILVLPVLFVAAARAEGSPVDLSLRLIAGVGAGLAMGLKPHFALPIVFAYLVVAWRRRSCAPVFGVESWTAGLVLAAYAVLVVVRFPAFLDDLVPIAVETYRQVRAPLRIVTFPGSLLYYGLLLVAVWQTRSAGSPPAQVALLAGSAGFFIAYLEQGKGWAYHLFPALALVLIVLLAGGLAGFAALLRGGRTGAPYRIASCAALAAALLGGAQSVHRFAAYDFLPRELAAAVAAVSPPQPSVLMVGGDQAVGHPLTRLLGGTWVGTGPSQWIADSAMARVALNPGEPGLAAAMAPWVERDRAMLRSDMRHGRPAVLLFDRRDRDYLAWALEDAEFASLLRDYRLAKAFSGIEIWTRVPRTEGLG